MNSPPPLYTLIERRQYGPPRIIRQCVDPLEVRQAADLLRWAGSSVEIVLITAIEEAQQAR